MDTGGAEGTQDLELPGDAVVVRQSQWSWLLFTAPWGVLALISVYIDSITFVGLPAILAVIVILPRYITYRSTAYILAPGILVIRRGKQRNEVPISEITGINVNPGTFGRSLGYAGVRLGLRDGRVVVLQYVPQTSPLIPHVSAHLDTPGDDDPDPV